MHGGPRGKVADGPGTRPHLGDLGDDRQIAIRRCSEGDVDPIRSTVCLWQRVEPPSRWALKEATRRLERTAALRIKPNPEGANLRNVSMLGPLPWGTAGEHIDRNRLYVNPYGPHFDLSSGRHFI